MDLGLTKHAVPLPRPPSRPRSAMDGSRHQVAGKRVDAELGAQITGPSSFFRCFTMSSVFLSRGFRLRLHKDIIAQSEDQGEAVDERLRGIPCEFLSQGGVRRCFTPVLRTRKA